MTRWPLVLTAFCLACSSDDGVSDGPTTEAGDTMTVGDASSHGHEHTSGETDEATSTPGADDDGSTTAETTASEDSTGAPVSDTWESWALPSFFEVYCNACHPGTSPRDFSDYDVVVANEEHIRCGVAPEVLPDCDHHIEPGHLPIGDGPFPSDDDRWRLVDWMQAGMPRD